MGLGPHGECSVPTGRPLKNLARGRNRENRETETETERERGLSCLFLWVCERSYEMEVEEEGGGFKEKYKGWFESLEVYKFYEPVLVKS